MGEVSEALTKSIKSIGKDWKKAKKQSDKKDRVSRRSLDRMRTRMPPRQTIQAACFEVMETAYMRASSGGKLVANARQIMYAARPLVMAICGEFYKNSSSFTQGILPKYLRENPGETAGWHVVYDARGKFIEPHTKKRVDLGTVEVRQYVRGWKSSGFKPGEDLNLGFKVATRGPADRYKWALFLEKEGFNELFKQVGLANQYDIAIMSTKGMSVTASRELIDRLSSRGVTTLVARDFDKSGFSIVNTLRTSSPRYRFSSRPNVIDLGLRLIDVQEMALDSEPVEYAHGKDPRYNLRQSGATQAECDFLVQGGGRWSGWEGQRVELNAMSSEQIVTWLKNKFVQHGVAKVIPDDDMLDRVYRAAARRAVVQQAVNEVMETFSLEDVDVPANLREQLEHRLDGSTLSWDKIVWVLASGKAGE